MSSIDGTTPQSYESELEGHYDPQRFVTLEIAEQDVFRLLDHWMKDFREFPHNHGTSEIIFDLIGKARKALSDMEVRVKKREDAAEKRRLAKDGTKAEPKPTARTKAKPKVGTKSKPKVNLAPRKRKTSATPPAAPSEVEEVVAK